MANHSGPIDGLADQGKYLIVVVEAECRHGAQKTPGAQAAWPWKEPHRAPSMATLPPNPLLRPC
jgi:hypothetical protein